MEKVFSLIAAVAFLVWIFCAIFFENDALHILGILALIFFLLRYFYQSPKYEEETTSLPLQEENKTY